MALAVMMSTTALAQRERPTFTGATSEFVAGDTIYLLHAATRQFYSYGNDWGTHVTLAERGIPLSFQSTGLTNDDERDIFEIRDFHPEKNAWYYAFLTYTSLEDKSQEVYHLYTDGAATQLNRYFCVETTTDGKFRIYGAETNDTLKHTGDFADYYLALDPDYVDTYHDGVLTGTGIIYASSAKFSQNEWLVVQKDSYAEFEEQLRVYDRAEELHALITEAEELGIENLENAKAAYANLELTYDELSQAIADIMQLFTQYYEEYVTPTDPINMTRYLVNPTFDGTLEGWTDEMGLSTFELGTWAEMIDGTAYEGTNYLNMWNGTATTGRVLQQATGLPNGVYGVTIAAHSDAEGGYIFAGDVETPILKGYVSDTQKGQDYTVVTLVTNGTLELGYRSKHTGSFWSTMDNARLMYYGAGEDAYAAWVDKSIEQAPDFTGARCQSALIEEYNKALEDLKNAALDETLMNYVKAYLSALEAVNNNIEAYNQLEAAINSANDQLESIYYTYATQAQDYMTNTASPALESYQLATPDVLAIIEELNDIIAEGNLTYPLFVELTELNDYLKTCIDTYASTCSEEAKTNAETVYKEVYDIISAASIENNEQIIALKQRIEDAIHDLRIPTGTASDSNPLDYTIYLVNPDFEDGTNGWTNVDGISTFEAANSWADGVSAMSSTGAAYLNLWHNAPQGYRVEQTITDLPNGTYTVGVTAYSNAENGAFVFANGDNVIVDYAESLPGNAKQYEVTTTVTDGILTIGVILYSEGAVWSTFDNFTVTAYGPNSVREPSGDAFALIAPVGIHSVQGHGTTSDSLIYNLAGQRLQRLQKGLNIVGGKKVLVK